MAPPSNLSVERGCMKKWIRVSTTLAWCFLAGIEAFFQPSGLTHGYLTQGDFYDSHKPSSTMVSN